MADRNDERDESWTEEMRKAVQEELNTLGLNIAKPPQTLVLSTAQRVWAMVLGVAAILAFIATFAQGWAAGFTWMCQVGWITTWCPLPG